MTKIIIKGLKLFAFHGVNDEEKERGQNFIFDVSMYVNRKEVKFDDLLDSTVNYSAAVKLIKKVVNDNKFNLIETLAESIAKNLLDNFTDLQKVEVEVKKPEAPMKVDFDYVAVFIVRTRGDYID